MLTNIENSSLITPNSSRPVKAVALYSGGLEQYARHTDCPKTGYRGEAALSSTISAVTSRQVLMFQDPFSAAEKFGFEVKLCHLSEKFIQIVKNPKFGHGKNMDPCMDCRILMLREAREFMEMTGSEFLITGEVLGQRPMSQRRDALDIIDREAGLKGHILRPLCAKLMKPTMMEEKGIVNRNLLHDFSGDPENPRWRLQGSLVSQTILPLCRGLLIDRAELFV